VKRGVVLTCALTLASTSPLLARDRIVKAIYCTRDASGTWGLQRFKPLINVQGGTTFAEMSFEGSTLGEVRVRRFYADSELAFDYRFDAEGRLIALRGSVTVKTPPPPGANDAEPMVFADWVGEAELTPGEDGKIPAHHVLYSREKDRIDKPDDADKYIVRFNDAPIYNTVQTVPCGAMLKEAEKMNATQD
jgi:hypothetical protein